ncbi:MAG: glyoxalase [Candidatus Rokuibacteriota bacterium]|nr:MAG: glyoxalase [Candidatus Rokubacteria bacterium]
MIGLTKIGHVLLRVADLERSKAFYRDVLGFKIAEQDPEHGRDVFMTLGEDFHTIDLVQHQHPDSAERPTNTQIGLVHIAFQVGNYEALKDAYATLLKHGVTIDRAIDHVSQRSLYFADPDGNRLEIYYERPGSLQLFGDGSRGDRDYQLAVNGPGEPLPGWLSEPWPVAN